MKWITLTYIFLVVTLPLFFLYMTSIFVIESIQRGEKGMDTAWMPYMWPIKSCLWIGIILLLIQGISEFLPVSSAAHLVIVSNYYSFVNQNLLIYFLV